MWLLLRSEEHFPVKAGQSYGKSLHRSDQLGVVIHDVPVGASLAELHPNSTCQTPERLN